MELADLCVRGAHVFYRGHLLEGCICTSGGLISYVGKEAHAPRAEQLLDARGLLALPGPIDAHVHLRDEGLAHKEDFFTGTCAAVAGGITTVLDMPNTVPPVDSARRLAERAKKARRAIVANVGFYALFPRDLSELPALAEAGAVGIKVFMHKPKTALDIREEDTLTLAVREASRLGLRVAFHAEDPRVIEEAASTSRAGGDPVAAFLSSHPPEAEITAVRELARLFAGLKLYICHVSVPEALEAAKAAGFYVEATPHHLFASEEAYARLGTLALVDPPLRPREMAARLREALYSGLVDVVASDHAPHTLEEKLGPEPPPGFPGLETLLPLLLNEVAAKRLPLAELVRLVCENPASIFGLRRGRLEVGWPADLVLVDLKAEVQVDPRAFFSKARYSPFEGLRLRGRPAMTIVNGRLAYADGEVVAEKGIGMVMRPEGAGRPRKP